jgi:hypothetical protein
MSFGMELAIQLSMLMRQTHVAFVLLEIGYGGINGGDGSNASTRSISGLPKQARLVLPFVRGQC